MEHISGGTTTYGSASYVTEEDTVAEEPSLPTTATAKKVAKSAETLRPLVAWCAHCNRFVVPRPASEGGLPPGAGMVVQTPPEVRAPEKLVPTKKTETLGELVVPRWLVGGAVIAIVVMTLTAADP